MLSLKVMAISLSPPTATFVWLGNQLDLKDSLEVDTLESLQTLLPRVGTTKAVCNAKYGCKKVGMSCSFRTYV